MLLKDAYQAQNKKQKSQFLQAILTHPEFKKGKEWLRKYLAGAYPKIDDLTEKICSEILNEGSPSFPFRSIETIEVNLNVIQDKSVKYTLWGVEKAYFEQIIKENIDSKSSSTTGVAWIQFGRNCTKDLHKINPFQLITELVSDCVFEDKILITNELIELYESYIDSKNHAEYLSAWEQFSLKARFIHFLNPFRVIMFIIKFKKNEKSN